MADVPPEGNQDVILLNKPEQNSVVEITEMTQDQEDSEPSALSSCDNLVVNPDDLLPPIVKLEKYAASDIVFNRQVVARNLLDTLRIVVNDEDEVSRVIDILCTLSDDSDPSVRAEIIQQIPYISLFCNKNGCYLSNLVDQCFVPMIIRYLTDMNNQVRKTSQATLLLTVEQGLIDDVTLEDKICSLILQLTESKHMDDCRTEAVNLMGKLAPLVGKEMTERLFLPCFLSLCLDTSFQVRKVCAENFGEFCAIVEQERTENLLLPKFYSLCEDSVCGVRKVCAEVFLSISRVCSMETRHNDLAPVFINLLCDTSRWVRMAAFQALGPFISTFAEPMKTGLHYNPKGILTVTDAPSCEVLNDTESLLRENEQTEQTDSISDSCLLESDTRDNVVPSCHDGLNCDSSVQSTECHNGCYSTVIELSSEENCISDNQAECLFNNDCDFNNVSEVNFNCEGISGQLEEETCETEMLATVNNLGDCENLETNELQNDSEFCRTLWGSSVRQCVSPEVGCEFECDETVPESLNISMPSERNSCTVVMNGIDTCDTGLEESESADSALDSLDCSSLDSGESSMCNSTPEMFELWTGTEGREEHQLECSMTRGDDEQQEFQHSRANGEDEEDAEQLMCSVEDCYEEKTYPDSSSECAFNHFQFWRNPIPDLELNFSLEEEICDKIHDMCINATNGFYFSSVDYEIRLREKLSKNRCISNCNSAVASSTVTLPSLDVNDASKMVNCRPVEISKNTMNCSWNITLDELNDITMTDMPNEVDPVLSLQNLAFVHEQDIVPPELLLKYLNMTSESKAQTFNSELVHHCAYSLPAVALTLGRSFWPCLRQTYNTLASDLQGFIMQWKIRRTLASSMHQLAVILGPDIAARDLLPVFSGLIKDLDEVRIGVLRHLSEFLAVLRDKERKEYLPRISEFINTDNERNWRFRLTLAEQLIPIADLYEPCDVREYLVPLSFALVRDKVSAVRLVAARVMAVMMRRMSQSPTPTLTKDVLSELAEQFIHAPRWLHRQIYVYLCQEFIKENSLPPDQFAEDAMPHLLYLCWDRVANVRLAIARCLAVVIWPQATFSDPSSPHQELLLQAIHTLQSDVDADVRYYANMVATHGCTCLHLSLN